MRRIAALLLIATSGWLLYQTVTQYLGGFEFVASPAFAQQLGNMGFLIPLIGGTLGLLGGLIVFLGGPGGAAMSMIGGVAVAGFALSLKQHVDVARIWESELAVGATILVLAGLAAIMGRN